MIHEIFKNIERLKKLGVDVSEYEAKAQTLQNALEDADLTSCVGWVPCFYSGGIQEINFNQQYLKLENDAEALNKELLNLLASEVDNQRSTFSR